MFIASIHTLWCWQGMSPMAEYEISGPGQLCGAMLGRIETHSRRVILCILRQFSRCIVRVAWRARESHHDARPLAESGSRDFDSQLAPSTPDGALADT